MKYIIKESQIDRIVFKYLDNQDFIVYDDKKKFDSYIHFLNSESDEFSQISVYVKNAFGEVRNWVFVNPDLTEELSNFFSIDKRDCLGIIKVWVDNTLGISDSAIKDFEGLYSDRLIVKK